jgi:hypothetical protein
MACRTMRHMMQSIAGRILRAPRSCSERHGTIRIGLLLPHLTLPPFLLPSLPPSPILLWSICQCADVCMYVRKHTRMFACLIAFVCCMCVVIAVGFLAQKTWKGDPLLLDGPLVILPPEGKSLCGCKVVGVRRRRLFSCHYLST